MARKNKLKFYSLKRINEKESKYKMIFGQRSNGKTHAVLRYALDKYIENGEELAIVRRWDSDFTGANSAKTYYDQLVCNGFGENEILDVTNGLFNDVVYYAGNYYLANRTEDNKLVRSDRIIARAFALNLSERYKGGSWPQITTIFFDEFATNSYYLVDEWTHFTKVLSSIIRTRDNVTVYMCANTVNRYGNPYFREMGINKIHKMKLGQIDVYEYGNSDLRVAVEYADGFGEKGSPSDVYFAFDNPKLKMITSGAWEFNIYKHLSDAQLPEKIKDKHIYLYYFIELEEVTLQAEIIIMGDVSITYIHRKTTPIKDRNTDAE